MAQNALGSTAMPELQLRHELKNRFPEVNNAIVIKVMKLYNNDAQKCIQALEQESQQRSPFSVSTDISSSSSHPHPTQLGGHHHPNDLSLNHNAQGNSYTRNGSQPPWAQGGVGGAGAAAGVFAPPGSQPGPAMPRRQEVPVKHETTHVSTVKHNVAPPSVPPKPLPSRPDPPASFALPPHMSPVQARPTLVINPANRGDVNRPMGPPLPDFSSFMGTSPRKPTDIPNIRCHPLSSEAGGGNSGSPESRRPVRVINVQGHAGGTVMSGPVISPTSASSHPRFRVVLGDGGGLCTMPTNCSPASSPNTNPYRFPSQPFIQPPPRLPPEPPVHSSSIYIDPTSGSRISQESVGCDPSPVLASAHPSQHFRPTHGPGSGSVPRTMQPLTVSLSSHAVGHGTPEQGQNVISYAGLSYNAGYNPSGFSHHLPVSSGDCAPPFPMSLGNQFLQQEGGASAIPNSSAAASHAFQVSLASQGLNHMTVSSGAVGVGGGGPAVTSIQPSSSPSMFLGGGGMYGLPGMSGMSPVMMHKPRLQHQPSTGSSTSRSNSMDSEHSGSNNPHHPSSSDVSIVDPSPPFPPLPTPPLPPSRVMGMSPMSTSSQSSVSSESSIREQQRRRSGSIQEEAAYTQALLVHQRQRMDKLTEDIENKRQMLLQLRMEVSDAEKSKIVENSLRTTFPTAEDIARLCESNRRLQTDIQMYLNEIDMYKNGQTPFSVIDPMGQQNFFNNMPTGPNDLFRPPVPRPPRNTTPPSPPPRPLPPRHHHHQHHPHHPSPHPPPLVQRVNSNDLSTTVPAPGPSQMQGGGSADSEEGEKWACSACTFENHPALKKCEICEMPRLNQGS